MVYTLVKHMEQIFLYIMASYDQMYCLYPYASLVISHEDGQPALSISITICYMYHHWSYLIWMTNLYPPSPSLHDTCIIIGHISSGWLTCTIHLHHCMLHTSLQGDQPAPSISITACYILHHWSYLIRMTNLHPPSPSLHVISV